MIQSVAIIWLVVGASLVGVIARVPVPPFTWLALTFLLHASRSLPALPGLLYAWLAVCVALLIGNRGIIPAAGPIYFAIVLSAAIAVMVPFVVDHHPFIFILDRPQVVEGRCGYAGSNKAFSVERNSVWKEQLLEPLALFE